MPEGGPTIIGRRRLLGLVDGFVGLWQGARLKEDSQARSIAEWLSQDSTRDPASDELLREIQGRLKLFLNLNAGKYARRDVRNAYNKILKSIDRHRDAAIPDAYLQFVSEYVP
jgi:hypothetical protein